MRTESEFARGGGRGLSSVAPEPIRRRSYGGRDPRRKCLFAVMAVFALLAVALAPLGSEDSEADDGYWKYTITSKLKSDGTVEPVITVTDSTGKLMSAAGNKTGNGQYSSQNGDHVGSWGFDAKTGYGPFGSFYAAFDACHGNRMICHLNPDDLTESVDGSVKMSTYSNHTVNIMWVLPTIYWNVTTDGSLIMSNDSNEGTAYAHTVDGDVHEYLAIGVYESSTATVSGKTVLTSTTESMPLYYHIKRAEVRQYANNNMVATADGVTPTGHAMLWNFYAYQLYRYCVLAVGGGWDSQGIFGNGAVGASGYSTSKGFGEETGSLDGSGPYAGYIGESEAKGTTDKDLSSVKVFIENPWGSLRNLVDGIFYEDTQVYANHTYALYLTQAAEPSEDPYKYESHLIVPEAIGRGEAPMTSTGTPQLWGWPAKGSGEWNEKDYSSGLYDAVWTGSINGRFCIPVFGGTVYMGSQAGISAYMMVGNDTELTNDSGRLAFVFDGESKATVEYDHSGLRALLQQNGLDTDVVDTLSTGMKISGNDRYEDLGYVLGEDGFKHVGWIIDGKQYPANHTFIKRTTHTAKSVWVGLPAVTYNHDELIKLSGDPDSVAGLSNGLEITGNTRYEQLPDRAGCTHTGWRIVLDGKTVDVGPTATFESRLSHTAYSLWKAVPTVIFDHTNLTGIVGPDADGVSDLRYSMTIQGNPNYPELPDTAGYRHTGWEIDGTIVGTTASLVKETTHTAKSLWEKISDSARPIPIIPDQEEDTIEVVVEKGSEPWLGKDAKNVLLIAIVVAIIAELAVLSISRKR